MRSGEMGEGERRSCVVVVVVVLVWWIVEQVESQKYATPAKEK